MCFEDYLPQYLFTGDEKGGLHMELNNFARIGKGVLSKSIGLQKNYVEVYEKRDDKLNEVQSHCRECPVFQVKKQLQEYGLENAYEEIHCRCKGCSQAVYEPSFEVKRKYINEKNKYGYQPTLKSNAIKLLLLYHFLQPDSLGFIKNVNIKELAEKLGCTSATIHYSNQVLAQYGYCYISESGLYDNHINILLPEYKNYHKTANEGGRGYITMSSVMMQDLLGIEKLNTLRLNLKGILEIDNASFGDTQNPYVSSATPSYKKLQGFLPDYCKRNVIVKALEQNDSIFNFTYYDKAVNFEIKLKYSQKNLREAMTEEAAEEIKIFVSCLNDVLNEAGPCYIHGINPRTDELLSMFHIKSFYSYLPLELSDGDYKDLASMSVQYSSELVHNAISIAYNQYIIRGKKIKQFGALIRSIIRNMSVYKNAS